MPVSDIIKDFCNTRVLRTEFLYHSPLVMQIRVDPTRNPRFQRHQMSSIGSSQIWDQMPSGQLLSCAWPHEDKIRGRLLLRECLRLCSVAGLNQAKLSLLGFCRSKALSVYAYVRACWEASIPLSRGVVEYYGNIPNVRPHYVGPRSSKPGLGLSSHFLCWVNSHPKGLASLSPFHSLKYCLFLSPTAIYCSTPSSHFFFLTDSVIQGGSFEMLHYTFGLF